MDNGETHGRFSFRKNKRFKRSVAHYTLHAKFHVVCDASRLRRPMLRHGKKQTLGLAQTHWGTLPQTPLTNSPTPQSLRGSLAGRQLKRCCLLRHQEGLDEVSLSTPYPPFGPVPLTDAIRGPLTFVRGSPR